MDTIVAKQARTLTLTNRQKEILIGSLLGDGHLARTTRGFAFRANHSTSQKEYVFWKYREFADVCMSPPHLYGSKSYVFRTVTHPQFDFLHREFYDNNRKILPEWINRWMTPLALAVWFMDDGARDKQQARFNTQSFSLDENQRLIHILEATLGIVATINRDKDCYRLRARERSMPQLRRLLLPHLLPSMQYKLSL